MKQFMRIAAMGIVGMVAFSAFGVGDSYIETDGTQAVFLNYYVKPTTKAVADYQFLNTVTKQQRVFGCNGALVFHHYINSSYGHSIALQDGSGNWKEMTPRVLVSTERRKCILDAPNRTAVRARRRATRFQAVRSTTATS